MSQCSAGFEFNLFVMTYVLSTKERTSEDYEFLTLKLLNEGDKTSVEKII